MDLVSLKAGGLAHDPPLEILSPQICNHNASPVSLVPSQCYLWPTAKLDSGW